jgi:hypothetical protein
MSALMLAVGGSSLVIAAASAANGAGKSSLTLSRPLPNILSQHSKVTVSGKVRHPPRHGKAILESMRSSGWLMLANTPIRKHGSFTLSWAVPASEQTGPITLRVVALNRRGRVVASSTHQQSAIGAAPVPCAPPPPINFLAPPGDGIVVGGRYNEGGAYPGVFACDQAPYTVTATNSSGAVAATQNVAGGHSYELVVPVGSYTLKSDFCSGSATVTAAGETHADTLCPVP